MLNINQNFDLKAPVFNFDRDYFNSLEELKAYDTNNVPNHFITNVAGTLYQFTGGEWLPIISTIKDSNGYLNAVRLVNQDVFIGNNKENLPEMCIYDGQYQFNGNTTSVNTIISPKNISINTNSSYLDNNLISLGLIEDKYGRTNSVITVRDTYGPSEITHEGSSSLQAGQLNLTSTIKNYGTGTISFNANSASTIAAELKLSREQEQISMDTQRGISVHGQSSVSIAITDYEGSNEGARLFKSGDLYGLSLGDDNLFCITAQHTYPGADITGVQSITAYTDPSITKVWNTAGSTTDLTSYLQTTTANEIYATKTELNNYVQTTTLNDYLNGTSTATKLKSKALEINGTQSNVTIDGDNIILKHTNASKDEFKISNSSDYSGAIISGVKGISSYSIASSDDVWACNGQIINLLSYLHHSELLHIIQKTTNGGYIIGDNSDYANVGTSTLLVGSNSHITGTKVQYALSAGFNTFAGNYAQAFGNYTTASGRFSHSEGMRTIASGMGAHAEGSSTTASGDYSHAEGQRNIASAICSHAEGFDNESSGYCSHSEGEKNIASGGYSHAEGYYTLASGSCAHAEGIFNVDNEKAIHSVGIGYFISGNSSTRKNAEYIYNSFSDYKDTKNGYKYLIGVGGYDGISTDTTTYKSVQEVLSENATNIAANTTALSKKVDIDGGKTQLGLDKVNNTADADKNVKSATILTTARKIWGQSFDGSADITGNLTVGTTVVSTSSITSNSYRLTDGTEYVEPCTEAEIKALFA